MYSLSTLVWNHNFHNVKYVIILDEFIDLIPNFISLDDAKKLLNNDKEYILTGHSRIDELVEIADYVTNFQKEKHPYDNGVNARRGIEY